MSAGLFLCSLEADRGLMIKMCAQRRRVTPTAVTVIGRPIPSGCRRLAREAVAARPQAARESFREPRPHWFVGSIHGGFRVKNTVDRPNNALKKGDAIELGRHRTFPLAKSIRY